MKSAYFITIDLEHEEVTGYAAAKKLAEQEAGKKLSEPMLVAWYDGKRNEEHPHVPECQHKPGWIAYAEGHGGRLQVNLNDGEYSFIFADLAHLSNHRPSQ